MIKKYVFACLPFLLPVLALGGPVLDQFFPLCNGDTKTFSSAAGEISVQVTSTIYSGQAAFEMRITSGSGATASDQRRYFRVSGNDLFYLGMVFSGGGQSLEATFNPPIVMLNESLLAAGGTRSGHTSAVLRGSGIPGGSYSVDVDYAYTVRASGPLSVPACNYGDSRSVEGSFILLDPADPEDPELLDFPEFLYLAPGVGIARIQMYSVNQFGVLRPAGFANLASGQVCGGPVCTGALVAMIEPPEAAAAGAQWRRAGTTVWRNSGEVESGLAAGQYTVEFKSLAEWNSPAAQAVTVSGGRTATVNAAYTPPTFALSGVIRENHSRGSLVSGITVTLSGGQSIQTTVTDGQGGYSFGGLEAGTYTVTPSHQDFSFSPETLPVELTADATASTLIATRTVAEPAVLDVQFSEGTIVISWPASLSGYVLERVDSLSSAGEWVHQTVTPATDGDVQTVSLSLDRNAAFFRLRKP